jgi:hypothetical protein
MSKSPSDPPDYVFRRTKALTELGALKPHEREVMTSLFTSMNPLLMVAEAVKGLEHAYVASGNKMLDSLGNEMLASASRVEAKAKAASDEYLAMTGQGDGVLESVAMSDLQQEQFSRRLPWIRNAIFDRLVAEGCYSSRPDRIRINYGVSGFFLRLLMVVAGAVVASMTKMKPLVLIGIGAFTGAIVLGFGYFLPARTSTGTRTLSKVLGFREFLLRVEKDQIERLEKTTKLFEKYLPYAMALGVETRWTQAVANITVLRPGWYRGGPGGGFMPLHLVDGLNEMSNQAGGGSTSSPREITGNSRTR